MIKQGEAQMIEIEAEENVAKRVVTKVRKDRLIVTAKIGNILNLITPPKLKITVTVTDLTKLIMSGMGRIETLNALESNEIVVKHDGMGEMDLTLQTGSARILLTGAGKIKVGGRAIEAYIKSDGIGKIDATNLHVDKATCVNDGAGECIVNATEFLDARMSGIGSIKYIGKPAELKSKMNGLGKIEETFDQVQLQSQDQGQTRGLDDPGEPSFLQ